MNRSVYIFTFLLLVGSTAAPAQTGLVATARLKNAVQWAQKHPKLSVGGAVATVGLIGFAIWSFATYKCKQEFAEFCFEQGVAGVEGNGLNARGQGIVFCQKAAEFGSIEASYKLGLYLQQGRGGVAKNLERAAYWYKKAADQGHQEAQYELGSLCEEDVNIAAKYGPAADWYKKAVARGNIRAKNNLAVLYLNGENGVEKNPQEAFKLMNEAAPKGDRIVKDNLGTFFENGLGVKPDLERAAYWYKESATLGYAEAQFHLGLLCEKNQAVAAKYGPEPDTDTEWGYRNPDNLPAGAYWYRRAAIQGYLEAKNKFVDLCLHGALGVKSNSEDVNKFNVDKFIKDVEQRYADAQYSRGLSFECELGEKNLEKAIECYERAAPISEKAKKRLEELTKKRVSSSSSQSSSSASIQTCSAV